MAQIRSSGPAVIIPARWLGGGAVALVHLLFLVALLMTDKLTFHKIPDARTMIVYRLPEEPMAQRPAPAAAGTPSRVTSLPSVATPRLDGPMILVRPDKPLSPGLPGVLDLSVHPGTSKTLEQLGPPTQEQRLKQFFKDSDAANRQAREPSAADDCVAVRSADTGAASLGESPVKDLIPLSTVCTPRASAKELSRRNERFAPQ
jgi:hypothetical protein